MERGYSRHLCSHPAVRQTAERLRQLQLPDLDSRLSSSAHTPAVGLRCGLTAANPRTRGLPLRGVLFFHRVPPVRSRNIPISAAFRWDGLSAHRGCAVQANKAVGVQLGLSVSFTRGDLNGWSVEPQPVYAESPQCTHRGSEMNRFSTSGPRGRSRILPLVNKFAAITPFVLLACDPSSLSTGPSATCTESGARCQLPEGPLGVCERSQCAPGATPPCFQCTPQQ